MDKQFRLAFPEQSNSPGLKTFAMGIWDTATESQSYQEWKKLNILQGLIWVDARSHHDWEMPAW